MTSRMIRMCTVGSIGRGGWRWALSRRPSGKAWPGILAMAIAGLGIGAPSAASAEPAVGPEQVVNQQVAQAWKVFQAAARAELELVRSTCGRLPRESRPAIVAAADAGVKRAAEEYVRRQRAALQGQGFDARQYVYEAVLPALEPVVSAEEFAAYQREHAARIARRAGTARLRIMDKLTTTLDLSEAQTVAIEADIRERWQPGWLVELDDNGSMANGLRPAPDFAAEAITSHLDERQRGAWEDWCRRAAASKMRIVPGWNGRSLDPDPWWQP